MVFLERALVGVYWKRRFTNNNDKFYNIFGYVSGTRHEMRRTSGASWVLTKVQKPNRRRSAMQMDKPSLPGGNAKAGEP